MASNQHEVSVRSRNQYSVVGDSGEVIQIEASGACRRRARALVCRNPARLGATGAANESRFGTGISARILRAGLHHAARASRGNHTFGAEHRQTGEFDDASLVRAVSDGTDYAQADRTELESLIRPTGFYRNKAASLIGLGQALVERFGGEVPATMDKLVTLPGVGRKTANVILGNAFGIPGITVDTHFGRLVRRWRWTTAEDPVKVEQAVGELIERKEWTLLSHRVIFHGRRVCHARRPACGVCVLAKDCPSFGLGPTEPLLAAPLVQGPETDHLLALAGL